jgi:hypothetical protein
MQDPALTTTTRRRFLRIVAATLPACIASGEEPAGAGRTLDFKITGDFGEGSEADIRAVLHSAADEIWKHCPATRWQVRGFFIFRNEGSPITLFDHTADRRVAIGLNCGDTFWAQYAFQFSHEFLHALAGHSNDWRKPRIRGRKPNHWLEEALCETASLFTLRAMAERHDLVAIQLTDPRESALPSLGIIPIFDKEKGRTTWVNTAFGSFSKKIADTFTTERENLREICKKNQINYLSIDTTQDIVMPLIELFKYRNKRMKRG